MLANPDLLYELTRRRVVERYIGSSFVMLWVVVAPLIPLALNLAVFYFVARIPAVQSMGLWTYALYIFSGLVPFRIVQSAVIESSELLVGNMEMLKNVNFPLHFLSMVSTAALMLELGVQLLVMLALLLAGGQGVGASILLLPLALILLVTLLLGASWAMSVVGYLLRDFRELLSAGFPVLLYLSPIMYPVEALPEPMKILVYLNPLSHYVIVFRDALLPDGSGLHAGSWLVATAISTAALAVGALAIWRTKRFVGDMV